MLVQSVLRSKTEKTGFNGTALNVCAAIEYNILLNKGITDIGGFVVPQAIMSNNKDEAAERVFKSMLYFIFTFVSPFLLLPLINKHFLSSYKIAEKFDNEQKRILEVSKKYLTKDGEYLKEGIRNTAEKLFHDKNKFDGIMNGYSDLEELRKDLINVHTKIHAVDFLTTNLQNTEQIVRDILVHINLQMKNSLKKLLKSMINPKSSVKSQHFLLLYYLQ